MSKLESIGKLRVHAQEIRNDWSCFDGRSEKRELDAIADEIEREIAEKYMKLPVDADGIPIHVGDLLELGDTRDNVAALSYRPDNGELPWEWLSRDDGCWYNTAFSHHVKPRTVEDVLREFAYKVCDLNVADEAIAKYAAELRMRDGE